MLSAIQAADPNLTITDTYYGPAWGYFVNGLSYGSNPNNSAGSAYDTSWVFWNGTYTAPGISWVNAESGISSNLLSNDSIDGFYYDPTVNNPPYVSTLAPDAPTTEVPEPAALSLIAAGSVCMLRRRKRRGA